MHGEAGLGHKHTHGTRTWQSPLHQSPPPPPSRSCFASLFRCGFVADVAVNVVVVAGVRLREPCRLIGRTVVNPPPHTTHSSIRVAPNTKGGGGGDFLGRGKNAEKWGAGRRLSRSNAITYNSLADDKQREKHCDVQRNTNARIEIITSLETLSISQKGY